MTSWITDAIIFHESRIRSTDGLESLINLDILDLHGNQITAVTNTKRLSALRVWNLAANSLKELPSLEGLVALQELNVRRNRIAKVSSGVGHAKKLERLFLSNNELRRSVNLTSAVCPHYYRLFMSVPRWRLTLGKTLHRHSIGSLTVNHLQST